MNKNEEMIVGTSENAKSTGKLVIVLLIILVIVLGVIIYIVESKPEEPITINNEELAEKLKTNGDFADLLEKTDKEIAIKEYELDENLIKYVVMYRGSGASAEEILIVEAKEQNYVNKIEENIEKNVQEKEEAFANYLPDEVNKIKEKILKIKGNYVILCISKDTYKIESTINEYLQER